MSLVLADFETELKSRARVMGAFSSTESTNRMRYAIRSAMRAVWNLQDWPFRNSTATIATSAGNLGPYTAPTGLVRFAQVMQIPRFGLLDSVTLAPILPTQTQTWEPYIVIQDGGLYFARDPGTGSLTLNYIGRLGTSINESMLAMDLLVFPDDLLDALMEIAIADIKRDLPGMTGEAIEQRRYGMSLASEVWEDSTKNKWTNQISPRGLHGGKIDFLARQITIIGNTAPALEPEADA